VFKKFHASDLPRTNYDCLAEERQELEGKTERDLIEKLAANYKLSQDTPLKQEFNVFEAGLRETTAQSRPVSHFQNISATAKEVASPKQKAYSQSMLQTETFQKLSLGKTQSEQRQSV